VIGKVHRLGLSGRGKSSPSSSTPRQRLRATKPAGAGVAAPAYAPPRPNVHRLDNPAAGQDSVALVVQPVEEAGVPLSQYVTIMELRDSMCRWPVGDPTSAEFRFCGAACESGATYCTHHARMAYQPSSDRRRNDRRLAARV
jgi:GcrA cell cycle regulator